MRPSSSYTSQITVSLVIQSKTQGSTMHIHWFTALNSISSLHILNLFGLCMLALEKADRKKR